MAEEISFFKDCYEDEIENTSSPVVYTRMEMLLSFVNTLEVKEVQEPTAADRGMAEEIIINLKRVEQDYRIDLTKEMEWLRNKVKKEE